MENLSSLHLYINKFIHMQNNSQDLPDYKKTFLAEMDELRRQEIEAYEQAQMQRTGMSQVSKYKIIIIQ